MTWRLQAAVCRTVSFKETRQGDSKIRKSKTLEASLEHLEAFHNVEDYKIIYKYIPAPSLRSLLPARTSKGPGIEY